MPIETQLVVAAIILVFAFFMVLVAWAEQRAGGSFDDGTPAGDDSLAEARPIRAEPAEQRQERRAA